MSGPRRSVEWRLIIADSQDECSFLEPAALRGILIAFSALIVTLPRLAITYKHCAPDSPVSTRNSSYAKRR